MSEFRNFGGQQFNAPGGTQTFHGIPPEQVTMMVVALNQQLATMQSAIDAQARGITDAVLQGFIGQIAQETTDTQRAVAEMQNMLTIAIGVQDEGRMDSNLGHFVDEVLRRRADLSAQGEYQAALAELDAALEREEAESRARQLRLIEAAIDEHLMMRDADGAARRILRRLEIETPDPEALPEAIRSEVTLWLERGERNGRSLDMRVAVAIAECRLGQTSETIERILLCDSAGIALSNLGDMEVNPARLEQAVAVYRTGMDDITSFIDTVGDHIAQLDDSGEALLNYGARMAGHLGAALHSLAERESGTDRLDQAIAVFETALSLITRERLPALWSEIQHNFGNALYELGSRNADPKSQEQAIDALRAALEIRTRETEPLKWAISQSSLANALAGLADLEDRPDRLPEAISACEAALQVQSPKTAPLSWGVTQVTLGNLHQRLANTEDEEGHFRSSVTSYHAALQVFSPDDSPHQWAAAQHNLGYALRRLGEMEGNPALLSEAASAYEAVLKIRTRDDAPFDWAKTNEGLGLVLLNLGMRAAGTSALDAALTVFSDTEEFWSSMDDTHRRADTLHKIGVVHLARAEKLDDLTELENAKARLSDAALAYYEAHAYGQSGFDAATETIRLLEEVESLLSETGVDQG